jgi:ubiquinone/menaquinone biosynthesis C-methylase UbiE
MADAREEHVWSNHSEEHKAIAAYKIPDDQVMRKWLTSYLAPDARVLDYGCGSGLWKDLFRDFEYFGADQNPGMIAVAKDRYPEQSSRFSITQWDKIPFSDATFDAVFTSSVIQHNTHEHKRAVLAEFRRILKPGGFYICTENTFRPDNYKQHPTLGQQPTWNPDMEDGYSFTPQGWSIFMQENGFRPIAYSAPSEYIYQKV